MNATRQDISNGYIGVVTVMIIALVTLAAASSVALLGVNELLFGYGLNRSHQALQTAEGCAEEAYFRLKRNPAFSGGTVPYAGVNCTVTVSGAGATRTITASAAVNDFTRTITVDVNLASNSAVTTEGVVLTEWQE